MKDRRITAAIASICIIAFSAIVTAKEDTDTIIVNEKAVEIAATWTNSLLAGDVGKTFSVSDVPFIFDGKYEITTLPELKLKYEEVVMKKGARSIRITKAEISKNGNARCCKECSDIIPVNCYINDEIIQVCVKKGRTLKVVGFKD